MHQRNHHLSFLFFVEDKYSIMARETADNKGELSFASKVWIATGIFSLIVVLLLVIGAKATDKHTTSADHHCTITYCPVDRSLGTCFRNSAYVNHPGTD
jgi:hypothetical protein